VRITLVTPTPGFLLVLAHQGCWIWPRELLNAYGGDRMRHAIGTGPFMLKVADPGVVLVLERNPNYWDRDAHGNALPFLDGMRVTYVPQKGRETDEFLKGRLTCLFEPPVEKLPALADSLTSEGAQRFILQRMPAFSTQFYGFRLQRPPFNDPRVREAFSLAIDRQFLVDSVLHGLAVRSDHGLVPPGLDGYPYDQVPELRYAPDSARALLAAAGYPGGAGFPSVPIQVNIDGFGYVEVADAVQAMLRRTLGIEVPVSSLPSAQHYMTVDGGTALMWRQGWIADYPDPETFLALLYGRNAVLDSTQASAMNTSRYVDPVFDSLYDLGQRTTDATQRMALLARAEARAMNGYVLAPLYHERSVRLLQPYVRDFPMNAMEYRDLSAVWFSK
jgi:peptide/nickel transport system substrate-binding protein